MRGLFDYEYQLESINQHQPPLQKLDKVIEWEWFRAPLEEAFRIEAKGPGGRPPFDRLMMFKILILQRYYNLSDEQTEFQIKDRLSFQQFLGLQIGDRVPDEKTVWLFKEQLKEKGLSKKLFDHFTQRLGSHGIVAKEGSIVDASFIDVPRQQNSREENAQIKANATPKAFEENPAKKAQKECDARWTLKNGERHYGYKNHVKADMKTKLITKFTTSSANVHDSQKLETLVDEEDKVVYADSAYASKTITEHLRNCGSRNHIHQKGCRNRPLELQQRLNNKMKSKIRVRVEHIFGYMTNSMNDGLHLRAIGEKRIDSLTALLNLTYNLFRYEQLVRTQKVKRI